MEHHLLRSFDYANNSYKVVAISGFVEDYDYYSFQRNKISPKKIDVKTF